jgi:transporter family protein
MNLTASWQFWALVAAVFAALTAIFAKVGISDIDSDLATFIRTCVIVVVLGAILTAMGKWRASVKPFPSRPGCF